MRDYANFQVDLSTKITPDAPHHNPFAARVNHTLVYPISVLLGEAGGSNKY